MSILPEEPGHLSAAQPRQELPLAEPVDRRRPGRSEDVSPPLLPLLRFKPLATQVEALHDLEAKPADAVWDEDDDDLRASRGILFGVVVAGLVWALIGMLMMWLG